MHSLSSASLNSLVLTADAIDLHSARGKDRSRSLGLLWSSFEEHGADVEGYASYDDYTRAVDLNMRFMRVLTEASIALDKASEIDNMLKANLYAAIMTSFGYLKDTTMPAYEDYKKYAAKRINELATPYVKRD